MKICQPHWDELRAAIAARGLAHLGAKDGKAAMEEFKAELNGKAKAENYDPLMSANMMIWNRGLECGGLRMMAADICPLCEAEKHEGPGTAKQWIDGCTDSIKKHCQEQKLI